MQSWFADRTDVETRNPCRRQSRFVEREALASVASHVCAPNSLVYRAEPAPPLFERPRSDRLRAESDAALT